MSKTTSGNEPRAYAQWVSMIYKNDGTQDIKVKNLSLTMGKLYADDNKDIEVPVSTYEGHIIRPGESLKINACGQANSPTGTEGALDMVDVTSHDDVIRHFHWNCPWGSENPTWDVSHINEKWAVECSMLEPGLGIIRINFLNKSQ